MELIFKSVEDMEEQRKAIGEWAATYALWEEDVDLRTVGWEAKNG